jgi:hypothetical protein
MRRTARPQTTSWNVVQTYSAGPTAVRKKNGTHDTTFATPNQTSTGRRPTRSRSTPTAGRTATLAAVPMPRRRPIVASVPPSDFTYSGKSRKSARLIAPVK